MSLPINSCSITTAFMRFPSRLLRLGVVGALLAAVWAWPSLVAATGGGIEVVEVDSRVNFPTELNFTLTAEGTEDIVDVQLFYRASVSSESVSSESVSSESVSSESVSSESVSSTSASRVGGTEVWSYAYADVIPAKRVTSNLDLIVAGSGYLPPGVDVEYYYVITDAQGNTHTTGVHKVEYLDGDYQWERTRIDSLTLLHHGLSESRVESVSRDVEEAISHIRSLLRLDRVDPIRGVIYNRNSDAQDAFPRQSQTITDAQVFGGFAFPPNDVFVGVGFRAGIIAHESAHLLLDQALGPNALPVPSWLNEGFAGYVEPGSRAYSGQSLSGRGLSLRAMNTVSGTPQSIGDFYRKSESVVAYMLEEYGVDRFQRLIAGLAQGSNIDQALTQAYGFDLTGLEARWSTDYGPPTAPAAGGRSYGTPWTSFSSVVIGGLALVVMAAWVIRFVNRKLRPEHSYDLEDGLQPWEDPDFMDPDFMDPDFMDQEDQR